MPSGVYFFRPMKIFSKLCALTLVAAFLAVLVPQSGVCHMSHKATVHCVMPCCKTPVKAAPSCPWVRPVAPKDAIGVSFVQVHPILKQIDNYPTDEQSRNESLTFLSRLSAVRF